MALETIEQQINEANAPVEYEGFYDPDFHLNFEVPKGMSQKDYLEYTARVNDSIKPEERVKFYQKNIPYNEGLNIINRNPNEIKSEGFFKDFWRTFKPAARNIAVDVATAKHFQFPSSVGRTLGVGLATQKEWGDEYRRFADEYVRLNGQPDTIQADEEFAAAVRAHKKDWEEKNRVSELQTQAYQESELFTDKIIDKYLKTTVPEINSFAGELGGGVGSMTPFLFALATGKIMQLAPVYGMISYKENKEKALRYGVDMQTAEALGLVTGYAEKKLEELAVLGYALEKTFPITKRILKGFMVEATPETLQQTKDIIAESTYRDVPAEEAVKRIGWSFALGGIMGDIGLAVHGIKTRGERAEITQKAAKEGASKELAKEIGRAATLDYNVDWDKLQSEFQAEQREKQKSDAFDGLTDLGWSPEQAATLIDKIDSEVKGVESEVIKSLKDGSYVTDKEYQRILKDFEKRIAKGQKDLEEALEQGGDAADIYLEQKDAYKERMLKAGKSEQEAEEESTFWATRDSSLWQALKDVNADISKEDFLKERTQRIENLPVDVKVDKQGNITPESEALLDEARERVAIMEENGATPEEIQAELENMGVEGGKLFPDVDKEWEARFGDYSVEDVKAYQIANDFEKKTYQAKIDSGMSEKQAIIETMDESIKRDSSKMNTESPLFSFVGEKANLTKKQRTSLDEAKALEQDGLLNNEQIRQTTGWSKGIDGQWKLEISDKDAKINIENITKQGLKLGDILSHDILYGAYPKLKDIPVVYNPNISAIASVRKRYSEIVLGRKFKNDSDTEQRKTIMHEVQHLIQGKEGFAVGGSTGNFRSPKTTSSEKLDLWRRNLIAEKLLDSLDLKSTAPVSTARRLMPEIKEKAKHSEFLQDRIKKFEELEEQFKEYDQNTSYAKYRKLGGELEANMTAERIDLTEEERRKTPVEYPADAIIKFDDGVTVPYRAEDNILFSRVFVKGKEVEAFDDIKTAEGKPVNYSNEGNYYDTGINRAARLGREETAVVRMSPQQFLELTPKGMGSRDVSNIEAVINEGKEIPMPFLEVEILDKDNKILKVFGHEGRHRSLAMSNLGVNDGYVILTGRDLYRNKDLLKDLSEWKILGQKETDISKAVPLSKNVFPSDIFYSRDSDFDYAKGSYYNKVASLYKGQSPDTLVHELSHDFFKSYFKLTEKYGLQDRNKDIYDMLGKKSSKEFGAAEWETLTEEFMKYVKTSESPNLASRNLFERAKDWLIKTFYTINQDEEVSPEVKEFFDNLISSDIRDTDLTDLQMTPRSLKEIFKSIKEGNEVGLKGVKRKDLLAIQKAMLTSTNRRGKTLAEEMRKDDMRIKAGSELAKQLGYDPRKKLSEQPVFGTEGIDSMDSLDEYLVEKGMLEPNHTETYEQSSDRESQIMSIIDQAESIYTPEQQKIADRKYAIEQNALKAQNLANDIIKDNDLGIKTLEDFNKYLDDAIRMAKSVDAVLVNKNALDFLFEGYENANKMVSKLEKDLKNAQDVIGVRQQLTDYVRRLPLNAQHRLSLLDKVKQVQKGDDFTEVLGKINDSFRTDWEQETKTLLRNNIDLIIKSTKPKDRKHQKYNYEYNKLFEEFRKINGLPKKDVPNALMDFMQQKLSEDSEFSEADRVKNLLLSYKANGMKSSIELMKQLESSLYELRNAAIEDRKSMLEAKAEKKQAQIKAMVNHVENTKKVDTLNATVLKATNLYSNEAELFGKDWADAHEMETVELAQNIEVKKRIEEQIRIGKEIYGIKGDYDYTKLMNEKSQKKFTLYGINGAAEGYSEQISLAQIMDIHNTIKNKRSREIYDWLYEQHDEEGNTLTHNIQDLLDNLTEQDKQFADALQKKIQSWRGAENKVYVNLYGIDMPEIENYYPRSSKKKEKELMDIKQFANIDMIPSFFKERSNFPFAFPENAWVKFQQRANDSVYMTNTFEKFKEQYDLIHNQRVSNAVVTKYDSQRFASLVNSLNDLSLNGNRETFDEAENLIGQGIGNWVVSQIAINPAVFTKQLVSLTNYAENMNVGDFIKYEAEFLMNPVKAINFMRDFDKEFLDYRFSNGMQNEVLAKIMGDAEKSLKKYGYAYQKYLDLITLPVRYGDVGAIYIGGYARVKQLLADGYSVEEARKMFRFETQRSQQSGLQASLSQFQKNRYAKLLTAFKNTQLQYMRKMQDSYIQWRRGEISTAQTAKIWANYMFIQATAYQILTNIFGFLRDDDDDKEMEWFKDVGMQILTAPIAGVPLLGEMAQDMIRDKHYDLGMAGLGDLNKFLAQVHSIKKKYYEDDLDAKTIAKGVATIFQFIKPLPNNIIKPILND